MKITKRQIRQIIRETLNEYGGSSQQDVDAGTHAGAQRLAKTLQNDILRGASLFALASDTTLGAWGYDTEIVSAMGVRYVEVSDGPNIVDPLVILPAHAADPGPKDVVAGKFIIGKLS